ncbi:MAG: M35 family metallo-endopeptidase, partial [Thermoanaerobaculia bacterium]
AVFALSLIVLCGPLAAQEGAEAVEARLEAAPPQAAGAASITFTLTNRGDRPVSVLKWHTPLEGIRNDIFRILHEGERVPYVGPMVKRGQPTAEDFVTLAPGETVSAVVDLGAVYAFPEPGRYEVRYDPDLQGVSRPDVRLAAGPIVLAAEIRSEDSEVIELREVPKPQVPEVSAPTVAAPEPGFINCSDGQKNTVRQALADAEKGAQIALENLQKNACSGNDTYKTWFGACDSTRYQTVTNKVSAIKSTLNTKTMTFNCAPPSNCDGTIAYVYKYSPYTIYLCGAYWNLGDKGYDTKAGTIVHEVSHFAVVADTSDYAYGTSACKTLAQNDPNKAIANADSYEYFGETLAGGLEHVTALIVILAAIAAERLLRRRSA